MSNYFINAPQHSTNVKVHQQPNDAADAARFYSEVLKRAREEVKSVFVTTENTSVHCIVAHRDANIYNGTENIIIGFKVNEQDFSVEVDMNRFDVYTELDVAKLCYHKIAEKVAETIISDLMRKHQPIFKKVY